MTELCKGKLYIVKFGTLIFLTPIILSSKIDGEVVDKWVDMSQIVYTWSQIFISVLNTFEVGTHATYTNLMVETRVM